MSHPSQRVFVENIENAAPVFFRGKDVLEIGSLDVNGSIRQFFRDCRYVGVDIEAGAGVDVVCEGQNYDAADSSFDVAISCECMEHNPFWQETFSNMVRLCRPGGLIIMSCATTGRPEHGTARSNPHASPFTIANGWNYYRNVSEKQWNGAFPLDRWFLRSRTWTNWRNSDLYFVGIKTPTNETANLLDAWHAIDERVSGYVGSVNHPLRTQLRRLFGEVLGDAGFVALQKIKRMAARSAPSSLRPS